MKIAENDCSAASILAIDFCDTLVDLQTADNFVTYTIKKSSLVRKVLFGIFSKQLFFRLFEILLRLFSGASIQRKEYLTYFLTGIRANCINRIGFEYCHEVLLPLANWEVIEHIKQLVHSGKYDSVLICSGGYPYYMHDFCREVGLGMVDKIVATELATDLKGARLTGGIVIDCMGINKVNLINNYLIPPFKLTVITDSISDWPLMRVSHSTLFVESRKVAINLTLETINKCAIKF